MKLTQALLVVCGVALLGVMPARATVFFERIEATVYADAWGFEGSGPVQTTLFNSIYMDRWAQTSPTDYRDANASFTGGGQQVVPGPDEYPNRYSLITGSGYANKTHPDAIARSRVDLWFTAGFKSGQYWDSIRDDAGVFTISCSGAISSVTIFYAGGSDVFASVSGGGSLSGRLSEVCSYHLVASVSGNGSYWFSVPSPGPLSLALIGVGLLCSRRRRAAL